MNEPHITHKVANYTYTISNNSREREREIETYMEPAAELAVVAELDVDALVEAETNEVQWLLHGALLFAPHLSSFVAFFKFHCKRFE